MKNKLVLLCIICVLPQFLYSQSYEDWDDHDVIRFYEKISLDANTLDEDGEEIEELYVTTKVEEGLYEVEVRKISSKLYQIIGTNIFMYFRFSPYLYTYDEGVLEVSYNSGIYYGKP